MSNATQRFAAMELPPQPAKASNHSPAKLAARMAEHAAEIARVQALRDAALSRYLKHLRTLANRERRARNAMRRNEKLLRSLTGEP